MHRSSARPYRLLSAEYRPAPSNLLVSVPHAGRRYDWLARYQAPSAALSVLRRGEDPYVDSLALPLVRDGVPLIIQQAPRVLADVNRSPGDMSPDIIALPSHSSDANVSEKARLGLGVVPTRLGADQLYDAPPNFDDFQRRLAHFHAPYHTALKQLCASSHACHDRVLLLDLHSMPRLRPQPFSSAHFVLGNRFGRSCPDWLLEQAANVLEAQGYTVARNLPYAGGYIVEQHSRPDTGLYALQVEVCRSLYLTQSAQRSLTGPGLTALRHGAVRQATKAALSKKGASQVVRALRNLVEVLQSILNQPVPRSRAAE